LKEKIATRTTPYLPCKQPHPRIRQVERAAAMQARYIDAVRRQRQPTEETEAAATSPTDWSYFTVAKRNRL